MIQKVNSIGGLLLTHVAVGVAGWLLARGWITSDQAVSIADQVKANWEGIVLGGGAVSAALGAHQANK